MKKYKSLTFVFQDMCEKLTLNVPIVRLPEVEKAATLLCIRVGQAYCVEGRLLEVRHHRKRFQARYEGLQLVQNSAVRGRSAVGSKDEHQRQA